MSLLSRLRAEDPGFRRLRFAGRCTLALVLAMVAAGLAAHLAGGPVSVVTTLGGTLALFASMLMQDPRPRVVLFMAGLMLPVSALAAVGSAAMADASRAGLLGVMVLGTGLQRFGPLGTAVGVVAFVSWFYALLAGARVDQWPWILLTCAVAVGAALTVRLVLVREHPTRDLQRLTRAFHARLGRLLEALGRGDPEDVLVQRQADLEDTALAIERLLHVPGAEAPEGLRRRLFRTELAVAGLLRTRRVAPADEREAQQATARAWAEDLLAERPLRAVGGLEELGSALRDDPTHSDPEATPGGPPPPPPMQRKGTALQMCVAGALAIVAGASLSATDWQFALFAAWLVLADSRMGTLRNVLDRVVGTAGGLIVGAGLGHLLSGRSLLELALILACVFVALWFMQVSQRVTVFLFAVMLSVLLGLSGSLTAAVLVTRLEETTLGALAGGVVAALLLPRRLRPVIDGAMADFLQAVEGLLRGTASVRDVNAAYGRVRYTARPGLAGFAGAVPGPLRRDLLALASLRDAARRVSLSGVPPAGLEPVLAEMAGFRDWLRGGPEAEDREVRLRGEGLARLEKDLWRLAEAT